MPKPTTLFVGLAVHRGFLTVAHADAHLSDPPVIMGSNGSPQADVEKLVRRFPSKGTHLIFVHEAGPTRPIVWGHKRDNYLFASSKW